MKMVLRWFIMKRVIVLCGLLLIGIACTFPVIAEQSNTQAAVIALDPGIRYQTITGWEATDFAGQDEPAFPNYKDELFDRRSTTWGSTGCGWRSAAGWRTIRIITSFTTPAQSTMQPGGRTATPRLTITATQAAQTLTASTSPRWTAH